MSNFKAELFQWVRFEKRVAYKRWAQLNDNDRRRIETKSQYIKNGYFKWETITDYIEILPPVVNPHINQLCRKLKKQKIKFTETFYITNDDVQMVIIEAIE